MDKKFVKQQIEKNHFCSSNKISISSLYKFEISVETDSNSRFNASGESIDYRCDTDTETTVDVALSSSSFL